MCCFVAAHAMRCFHGGWSGRVEAGVLGEVDAGSLGGKAGTLLVPLTQKIIQYTVYGNDSRENGTHPQRISF